MEITPLVSILMTTYNRQNFVAEAIKSVLASEYQHWELIIVDDCSDDETFQIATGFAKKDSRMRLYQNEKNLGDYSNRNKAASYATGKYIVIVDSDDCMFSDSLSKWVDLIQESNCEFGIFAKTSFSEIRKMQPAVTIPYHFFKEPLLMYGPIATIVSNDYFRRIKGFPEKYGPANDMYYNLKAASGTDTLIIPFPLVNYREHEGQEKNNMYSYLYNNYRYLRDALSELDLPLTNHQKKYLLHKVSKRFLVNVIKFFYKTSSVIQTKKVLALAEFAKKDLLLALKSYPRPKA